MSRIRVTNCLLVVAVMAMTVGCASTGGQSAKRSLYVDEHPELSESMVEAILSERIMVGMSQEMIEVTWGGPSRVEEIEDSEEVAVWIYGNYFVGGTLTYLYFTEDLVLHRYEVTDEPIYTNQSVESSAVSRVATSDNGALSKSSGNTP